VPFSCKTRFCPSCGKVRTDEWVGRISQELLDVPQLHLTLTIAKEMRLCFDRDRSLLKLLLTTANDAVRLCHLSSWPLLTMYNILDMNITAAAVDQQSPGWARHQERCASRCRERSGHRARRTRGR
jgi:hypothetical protein